MSIEAHGIRKKFGAYTALDGVDLNDAPGEAGGPSRPLGLGQDDAASHHRRPRVPRRRKRPGPLPRRRRDGPACRQEEGGLRHTPLRAIPAHVGLRECCVRAARATPARPALVRGDSRARPPAPGAGPAGRPRGPVPLSALRRRAPARCPGPRLPSSPRCFLDEPFGALDARVRKDLRRWLRRFHDEIQSPTTIFVTHDQEEALEIADEVVIMNKAHVEQVGTPQQVYDKPAPPVRLPVPRKRERAAGCVSACSGGPAPQGRQGRTRAGPDGQIRNAPARHRSSRSRDAGRRRPAGHRPRPHPRRGPEQRP